MEGGNGMELARMLCYYGSMIAAVISMCLRISAIYSESRITKGIGIALLAVALMAAVASTALSR